MKTVLLLVLIGCSSLSNISVGAFQRNITNSHVTSFTIAPKVSYQYSDDGETDTLTEIIKAQLNSPEGHDALSRSGTVLQSKTYDTMSNSDSLTKEHRVGGGEPNEPKSVYHYYYPATMTSNVGNGKSLSGSDSQVDEDQPIPSYSYAPSQNTGYQSDMSYGVPQPPSPSPQYGYPQSPPSSGYDSPAPQPPQSNYGYPAPVPSPTPSTGYGYPSPPAPQPPQSGYGYPAPPAPQPTYGYPAPPAPAPQPSYGYPAAPSDAPPPASGYGYAAPSPKPAPVYGYPAAPQPAPEPQGGYSSGGPDYGYGHGQGDLPSISTDGGAGGFGGAGGSGGDPIGPDGPPPPPPPPPPPAGPGPIKGSIDYILIPMILIGIAAPIFVVMYVVLGSMEAKLAPVLFKRSMSWASSIAESWKPTTDALMSSVSRALDQHQCWERMACHAGSFCHRQGISSPDSLEKKLEAYVPQSYKRQYRAFTLAMKSSKENCSVYTCP